MARSNVTAVMTFLVPYRNWAFGFLLRPQTVIDKWVAQSYNMNNASYTSVSSEFLTESLRL